MKKRTAWMFAFFAAFSSGMAGNLVDDVAFLKTVDEQEYIRQRDEIIQRGLSILPELDSIESDGNDWELSLYASICAEHIRRGNEIETLLNYDWKNLPDTESLWNAPLPITGIPHGFGPFFRQKLVQEDLWFLYLEIFAGKQPIDHGSAYHLLYEGIPDFVVECSKGDIRQMAARIAEKDVLRKTDGNICTSEYLKAFSIFVKDGTYPQGTQYFLSHLRLNGHLQEWALNSIHESAVMEALLSQYSDDTLVTIALRQHLQSIGSTTDIPQTNHPVKQATAPSELSGPKSLLPSAAETPLVSVEDHSRRSLIAPMTLGIISALAVMAFLVLKRRHRP